MPSGDEPGIISAGEPTPHDGDETGVASDGDETGVASAGVKIEKRPSLPLASVHRAGEKTETVSAPSSASTHRAGEREIERKPTPHNGDETGVASAGVKIEKRAGTATISRAVSGAGVWGEEQEDSLSSEIGGLRILRVQTGSPAEECGLEVCFDLVVEANGMKLRADEHLLQTVKEAKDAQLKLVVYNTRTRRSRDVFALPRKWGGTRPRKWGGMDLLAPRSGGDPRGHGETQPR